MADESRCCGGRCCETTPIELNRRDFMEKLAIGTAALAVIGGDFARSAAADEGPRLTAPNAAATAAYPRTPPRVYKGPHLEEIAMPLGGIGTGSIWLDGRGRLSVWQIFNNLGEPRVPDSFFAVRVRAGAGAAVTRVLQTTGEGPLQPVESLEYEGGYPIARLAFHDPALPVQIVLEATNPMIPLDAANSSIPCAVSTDREERRRGGRRDDPVRRASERGRQWRRRRMCAVCGSPVTAATATKSSARTAARRSR